MYLKRKVDDFLCEWKSDPNRKPLVIKGSRQVGKTESIKHFAAANYESISIDLCPVPDSRCPFLSSLKGVQI